MIKHVLTYAFLMLGIFMASAQQPNPLPLDPAVKHGVLPNGLNYYILHNEQPKGRANFYIAQKVGSSLETEQQLGLAHFLEHMAFNGTKHFPGKNMLNYLQANGIRFGADINAYTAFDETVYNIDNIPTDNQALMDSVLLVLRDWSCDILLEDDEIDAERKVIQEEWRMRNDAGTRMYSEKLKKTINEYQYARMPIGTMEIVMNFPYKDLRDYYHKWYRPDQQGIIIVGDFDAAEMEQKVINLFSDIPMDPNAAPREYVAISDNEKPIYFTYEDPELPYSLAELQIKHEKIPMEFQNTDAAYISDNLLAIICNMINTRLAERSQEADCQYAQAGVTYGNFTPSKTKSAFTLQVVGKDQIVPAFEDAFSVVVRACKTGFNESELDRVKENIIANLDKQYNERNNTSTSTLAHQLISAFTDNESYMGIEKEREFVNAVLQMIPLEAYNMTAAELITPTNQIVSVVQQKAEGKRLPTEELFMGTLNDVLNRQFEAYVDEVITDPLIAKLPKKGSVKSEKPGKFDTTEITLSNGIKVIVKKNDYKADEILFTAFRDGGKQVYDGADAPNVLVMEDVYNLAKLGKFDVKQLRKYLNGKHVGLSFDIGQNSRYFSGSSTVKDLPTLMELIYASFTDVNPDKTLFENEMAKVLPMLRQAEETPEYTFKRHQSATRYDNNPMEQEITASLIEAINYDRAFQIYKDAVANPADYTFIFTGNVDLATLKPLLEQYIASLPTKKTTPAKVKTPIQLAKGQVKDSFDIEMATPATWLYGVYNGYNIEPSIENDVKVDLIGDILGNIYTEVIREKEGGAYSPSAGAFYDPVNGVWNVIYMIQTNAEQAPRVLELADQEFINLLKNGANAEQFNKVKEAALKQYENKVQTNNYWQEAIRMNAWKGYDQATTHRAAIENLTLQQFNDFMKNLYDGKNFIQVIMNGKEKK